MHTFLVLDWNGTVMSDVNRAVQATNELLKDFRIAPLDVPSFRATFTLPMSNWLADIGIPAASLTEAETKWNLGMQSPAPMRAGAAALIRDLKGCGISLGVVTAAHRNSLNFDIAAAGLPGVFESLQASSTNKTQSLLDLRKETGRHIYVGDTTYDVESARSAGYETVAVSGGYQSDDRLKSASPDHFARSFEDLRAITLGRVTKVR